MTTIEPEKSRREFKLNKNSVAIVQTEKEAEKVYRHKLTITIESVTTEPLHFASKSAIAKLLQEADLEDEQTNLFPELEDFENPKKPVPYKRRRTQ